jgi:hypothetical protein
MCAGDLQLLPVELPTFHRAVVLSLDASRHGRPPSRRTMHCVPHLLSASASASSTSLRAPATLQRQLLREGPMFLALTSQRPWSNWQRVLTLRVDANTISTRMPTLD